MKFNLINQKYPFIPLYMSAFFFFFFTLALTVKNNIKLNANCYLLLIQVYNKW